MESSVVITVVGNPSSVVVMYKVVVGREVVVRLMVVVRFVVGGCLLVAGAFLSLRRTVFFTSLNQPGTSMRQQYTPLSPSTVSEIVKETSPLVIVP